MSNLKYFIMADGRQQGPFTIDQLPGAGLRPETYVWCKGMDNWQKAADVADICRFYRQRLSGTLPEKSLHEDEIKSEARSAQGGADAATPFIRASFRQFIPADGLTQQNSQQENWLDHQPPDVRFLAWFVTLLLFPPTGVAAIFYASKSRNLWRKASQASRHAEAQDLARLSHDACRIARMLVGISTSLGVILYATLFHNI